MDNKFFTFIKPYLSFIDNGNLYRKPFRWLYELLAIVNLILPILVFYYAIDNDIFDATTKLIIVFLIIWIIFAFSSWVSFQILWNRRMKVLNTSAKGDEFVVIPVFSHLIQTLGEFLGTWIGIVGFGIVLFSTIILGEESDYLSQLIGQPTFMSNVIFFNLKLIYNFLLIILMPICGFLIIVASRFMAELFRALSSIANNTKKN